MIETFINLFKALNSETEPGQISLGLVFGMVAGLTPLLSLHNLLVLLLVSLLRVNGSAFMAGLGLFAILGFAMDPLFHQWGYQILTHASLQDIWTNLYNTTLGRLENFNNTIVMGSLAVSLAAFLPMYFLFNWLIRRYRENVMSWVVKTHLVKILKTKKWFSLLSDE